MTTANVAAKPICGIVRPISPVPNYRHDQWSDVQALIEQSIGEDYDVRLVSDSDVAALIQGTIVKRLNSDPIVIVDVSTNNPNVLMELGMRLAFDLPVIIIKDDITPFNFDAAPIYHEIYPIDLRHQAMEKFKQSIRSMVDAAMAATKNPDHVTYLQAFGSIKIAEMAKENVSLSELILSRMDDMSDEIARLTSRMPSPVNQHRRFHGGVAALEASEAAAKMYNQLQDFFEAGGRLEKGLPFEFDPAELARIGTPKE